MSPQHWQPLQAILQPRSVARVEGLQPGGEGEYVYRKNLLEAYRGEVYAIHPQEEAFLLEARRLSLAGGKRSTRFDDLANKDLTTPGPGPKLRSAAARRCGTQYLKKEVLHG